ncbi:hypothetical protein NA57DRAFT_81390 [Rhizodiscina lignyota]|uniref:BTB domain-containing protein n=1 Tax=Rhizodiscina lignyota TaxID=1504668 RepID=A0A9P4M1E4_9PEZI|nr:hypothetical protein NA57DRAFT_81390 [Rhizodiscina lignyota]
MAAPSKDSEADDPGRAVLLCNSDQTFVTLRPVYEQTNGQSEAVVHKVLLCHFSENIKKLCDERPTSDRKPCFTVPLTSRTLAIFLSWIYTSSFAHVKRRNCASPNLFEELLWDHGYYSSCKYFHNNVCQHDLLELYIFAHAYNVRALRSDIRCVLQALFTGQYETPGIGAALVTFDRLPESNGLHKLFSAFVIRNWRTYLQTAAGAREESPPTKQLEELPKQILVQGMEYHATGLDEMVKVPGGISSPKSPRATAVEKQARYAFHEHKGKNEEQNCDKRWACPSSCWKE